jgi:hypothetical protein
VPKRKSSDRQHVQNSKKSLDEGFCDFFVPVCGPSPFKGCLFLGGQALNATKSISKWFFIAHF